MLFLEFSINVKRMPLDPTRYFLIWYFLCSLHTATQMPVKAWSVPVNFLGVNLHIAMITASRSGLFFFKNLKLKKIYNLIGRTSSYWETFSILDKHVNKFLGLHTIIPHFSASGASDGSFKITSPRASDSRHSSQLEITTRCIMKWTVFASSINLPATAPNSITFQADRELEKPLLVIVLCWYKAQCQTDVPNKRDQRFSRFCQRTSILQTYSSRVTPA